MRLIILAIVCSSLGGCWIEDRPAPPPKPEKMGGHLRSDYVIDAQFAQPPVRAQSTVLPIGSSH